ncbi:hypothetical protein EK0264_05215 [Epidermidibacterium keratini]|uniref:Uncharacterized protein n=1 Tax=Epidermidibacterium keratini TaxID=1891644 RepID=A0A7L4YKT3_9ACTN|nr:hypothetical protein [Epidermidibacterium keratini]QHB99739.1 hypothetical protein EK0264_05215 [Epidermidibacterium keratini]
MVSPFYRIVAAPLRSLAFAIFGGLALAHASVSVAWLTNQATAGIFPFAVLVALGTTASWLSWRERYTHGDDEALVRYAVRSALVLIAVVCLLSAFSPNGGLITALVFGALTVSLVRVRPDYSQLEKLTAPGARRSSHAK